MSHELREDIVDQLRNPKKYGSLLSPTVMEAIAADQLERAISMLNRLAQEVTRYYRRIREADDLLDQIEGWATSDVRGEPGNAEVEANWHGYVTAQEEVRGILSKRTKP